MKRRIFCLLLAILITAVLPTQILAVDSLAMAAEPVSEERTPMDIVHYDPSTSEYVHDDPAAWESVPLAEKVTIRSGGSGLEGVSYYGYTVLGEMGNDDLPFQRVYDLMFTAAKQYGDSGGGTSVSPRYSFSAYELPLLPLDTINLIFHTMRNDHPEFFWLQNECLFWVTDYTPEAPSETCVDSFALRFYTYDDGLPAAQERFRSAADDLLTGITGSSAYELEFSLHNTLAECLTYAPDQTDHGAYTTLVTKTGSSAGLAVAFQYLLQRLRVNSFVVTGQLDGAAHVWNIVKLDESWYYVDLALDMPISKKVPPRASHNYFNKGSKTMDYSHIPEPTVNVFINTLEDHQDSPHFHYYFVLPKDRNTMTHTLRCRCGDTIMNEEHSFGDPEIIREATCTKPGSYSQTCTTCWYTKTVAIPATGHSYGAESVSADDLITRICTTCSDVNSRSAFLYIYLSGNEICITGYEGIRTDIVIPDQLKDHTVVQIQANAFQGKAEVTSVTIPVSVKVIEEGVFSGCDALTDIYYGGNRDQWAAIKLPTTDDSFARAMIHYTDTGLLLDIATEEVTIRLTKGDVSYQLSSSDKGDRYTASDLPKDTYLLSIEKEGFVPYQREYEYDGHGGWLSIQLFRPGDINGSGDKADAKDMQRMYEHLTGTSAITDLYLQKVADVNGDGAIDVYDLQRLYEHVTKINEF